MIKKTRFITSALALFFGFLVFSASLIMASQVQLPSSPKVSERQLYMGDRILPDHVFYPLLMIADKIILETSFGNRRIYVKIRLADDRLYSAKMLIEKGHEELALSTMTKSQKYLITAAQDFLGSDEQLELVKKDLLASLKSNSRELKKCGDNFNVVETSPIDALLIESNILIDQLK